MIHLANGRSGIPAYVRTAIPVSAMVLVLAACDSSSSPDISSIPLPAAVVPANFPYPAASLNTYFPLEIGMSTRLVSQTADGEEIVLVEVTNRQKLVQGVTTTVVRDRVWLDGELIEDTDDWYAQDKDGNVWYFGEDVKNYSNGVLTDRAGSWEAGVDGALAGIIMWAQPSVGQPYYQEYYRGHAEDVGEVLALNETVTVPLATYTNCIKTEDTTALEPDVLENKFYCPGVGVALVDDLTEGKSEELVEVIRPNTQPNR